MTITPDNSATSWRDLADELTDQDRAAIERLEQEPQGQAPAGLLLKMARDAVEERMADMAYCDVPAPVDANWVGKWEKNIERDGWSRSLVWREFRDGEMYLAVDGSQQCDGTVERGISVYLDDDPTFTSAEVRRLAGLLVDAADELDALK